VPEYNETIFSQSNQNVIFITQLGTNAKNILTKVKPLNKKLENELQ